MTAVVVRTLPNDPQKAVKNHSGKNPPYFTPGAMNFLLDCGVQHLLVDLPSVDREEDDGMLPSHCTFWNFDRSCEKETDQISLRTITELCFIPEHVQNGLYLLDLQVAPFHLDAAPSKPILYPLEM